MIEIPKHDTDSKQWFAPSFDCDFSFRQRLQEELGNRLVALYFVVGLLYGFLTICHPIFIVDSVVGRWLSLIAGTSLVVCLSVAWGLKRVRPSSRWVYLWAVVLAVIMSGNSAGHLSLTSDPVQSTNFLLVAIGAGCVLNRFWVWLVCVGAAWGAWLFSGPLLFSSPHWTHYGFMMIMGSVLSGMILSIGIRQRIQLELSRRQLEDDALSLERSNQALQETERRLVEAQEIAQVGSWQYSVERRELWWSEEVYRILGWPQDDRFPRWQRCRESVHPDDLERLSQEIEGLLNREGRTECEFNFVRADRESRCLFLRGQSHFENSGKLVRLSGTIQDVTAHREQANERETLETQLRRAQRMDALGTLAGGIAHDFNNILFSIMGNAQLAELDIPEGHAARRSLENIVSASKRARDVVRQILTFSQRQEVSMEETQLCDVVKEVLELLRASMPPSIEIRTEFESDCPTIAGDQSQIHQILVNLCSNALDAMRDEGGMLKISVSREWPNTEVRKGLPDFQSESVVGLRVEDTGVGMGAATLERVFEPFFTTKSSSGGTGLGLAVVHGIVKRHGGAITVRSVPGQGTVFNLFFPIMEQRSTRVPAEKRELARGDGQRLLLVDDEVPVLRAVSELLDRLGYRVTECSNPLDCERLLKQFPNRFDLVLTDLRMREMLGTELARRLSRIRPEIPIILITGHASELNQSDLKRFGVDCLVQKPATIETLSWSVHDALRRSQAASVASVVGV